MFSWYLCWVTISVGYIISPLGGNKTLQQLCVVSNVADWHKYLSAALGIKVWHFYKNMNFFFSLYLCSVTISGCGYINFSSGWRYNTVFMSELLNQSLNRLVLNTLIHAWMKHDWFSESFNQLFHSKTLSFKNITLLWNMQCFSLLWLCWNYFHWARAKRLNIVD